MAPTGAFREIYRPRDSDRRSLIFMLSGLKKEKRAGVGVCVTGAGKEVCVQSFGTGCGSDAAGWCLSGLVNQSGLQGFQTRWKKGARILLHLYKDM